MSSNIFGTSSSRNQHWNDQRDSEASLPAMGNGAPVAPQWPKAQPQPIQPGGSSDGMRVLPLEQIAASFEAYKAQRHHGR